MKKFYIIYENRGGKFVCNFECTGLFDMLHRFEAEKKLNIDCIISIDIL